LGVHGRGGGNVEHGDVGQRIGVIQCHSMSDPPPAVVADHGKAWVSEGPHHLDLVSGHLALRVIDMTVAARRAG
jgi:hypothetical protein